MKMTITPEGQKKMKRLKNMDKGIRLQMEQWGSKTVRRLKEHTLGGGILNVGTAHLKRNVAFKVHSLGHITKTEVGTGVGTAKEVKYARIQEKGGVIKPKRAKMLTIPFRGVKGKASNYPGAFIVKKKSGKMFIAKKKGRGLQPLFTLKKQVRIPARRWLSRTINEMKPYLYQLLRPKDILNALKRVGF